MPKNILYVHGLNSSKESYTGNLLKTSFPQYQWTLESFQLMDVYDTIHKLVKVVREHQIDTIVSSSLGCVYNLYIKRMRDSETPVVNKILINPCCFPSRHLAGFEPLPPRAMEYCDALEDNIYHHNKDNCPEKLFGIFAKDDELFQYHDFFVEQYGAADGSNALWIEGKHAEFDPSVIVGAVEQGLNYFEKQGEICPIKSTPVSSKNLADPTKPYVNPYADRKPVLYFDMDGVLVDFYSGVQKLDPVLRIRSNGDRDEVPGIFGLMEPMPGAVEAFHTLAKHFDVYILTTSPWNNPTACNDKLAWVKRYLGGEKDDPAYKRLIISHHKDKNKGDILIDDRPTKNGADKFEGLVIPFGSAQFPDWSSVLGYLVPKE